MTTQPEPLSATTERMKAASMIDHADVLRQAAAQAMRREAAPIVTESEVPSAVEELRRFYALDEGTGTGAYLQRNPALRTFLLEAHSVVRKYFPDEWLVLSISVDPEEQVPPELLLTITMKRDADDALDRLQRLDDEWWSEASRDAGRGLSVTVGFEDPA